MTRRKRGGKNSGNHVPNSIPPHNPDEETVEMGKRNPVAEKDHTPLTTGQKSDERPPAARKKSIRASLGRAASKLIGKEVEKWKPFTADDGRTYYITLTRNFMSFHLGSLV